MRNAALAMASVCVLAACNPSAPTSSGGFPDITGGSYRAEANIIGEDYVISSIGGRQMAMRISAADSPVEDPAAEWSGDMAATATRTGDCNVAGESGAEWTRTAEGDGDANSACVTNDGIILRAREGDRVVWETTSVQRGPQSADQFTLPAGVQVMDLGAMMAPASPGAPGGGDLCTTLRNAGAPADALAQAGC